mmetsp:Transcript_4672/g.12439  ORF Transcript_4672/g.12439 Transcript_4672/m.12439 type:complete len:117 (-) Transcript_4672:180-530(-)
MWRREYASSCSRHTTLSTVLLRILLLPVCGNTFQLRLTTALQQSDCRRRSQTRLDRSNVTPQHHILSCNLVLYPPPGCCGAQFCTSRRQSTFQVLILPSGGTVHKILHAPGVRLLF